MNDKTKHNSSKPHIPVFVLYLDYQNKHMSFDIVTGREDSLTPKLSLAGSLGPLFLCLRKTKSERHSNRRCKSCPSTSAQSKVGIIVGLPKRKEIPNNSYGRRTYGSTEAFLWQDIIRVDNNQTGSSMQTVISLKFNRMRADLEKGRRPYMVLSIHEGADARRKEEDHAWCCQFTKEHMRRLGRKTESS